MIFLYNSVFKFRSGEVLREGPSHQGNKAAKVNEMTVKIDRLPPQSRNYYVTFIQGWQS